ncbi:MAG: ribbon-helix-helix domain-containing protein [Candidatus Omnitrophota bacterium]
MRNTVAISLPDSLLRPLSAEAKEEHTSRSEIIRQALKYHFFVREFTRVRNKAMVELARKGITLTEEEIFKKVS